MEDTTIRDHLALERTRLANERTLLAYVRTALAAGACGVALIQVFPDRPLLLASGWGIIAAGCVTLLLGSIRFLQVARRLTPRPLPPEGCP